MSPNLSPSLLCRGLSSCSVVHCHALPCSTMLCSIPASRYIAGLKASRVWLHVHVASAMDDILWQADSRSLYPSSSSSGLFLDWTVLLWICIITYNVNANLVHKQDTQRLERCAANPVTLCHDHCHALSRTVFCCHSCHVVLQALSPSRLAGSSTIHPCPLGHRPLRPCW